jgi:hypothetical protein
MAFLTDQIVQQLADAIKGNDRAQEALQRTGRTELIHVLDAIRYDDEASVEWLHENGFDEWGLFIAAIDGDPYAVQALFDGKQARLAMVADSVLGSAKSDEYFKKNGLKAWINFAEAIKQVLNEEE